MKLVHKWIAVPTDQLIASKTFDPFNKALSCSKETKINYDMTKIRCCHLESWFALVTVHKYTMFISVTQREQFFFIKVP